MISKHLNLEPPPSEPTGLTVSVDQTLVVLTGVGERQLEYHEGARVDVESAKYLRIVVGKNLQETPWGRITGVAFYCEAPAADIP